MTRAELFFILNDDDEMINVRKNHFRDEYIKGHKCEWFCIIMFIPRNYLVLITDAKIEKSVNM